MSRSILHIVLPALMITTTGAQAQKHIALNFGLNSTKPLLGLSYSAGKNEINAGVKGFGWSGRDGWAPVIPGISYNRLLTSSNIYGSVGWILTRYETVQLSGTFDSTSSQWILSERRVSSKWDPGLLTMGIGKSIQYTHWGIHIDASLLTSLDDRFGQSWKTVVGIGTSYRFHLGE
jgi:hypothetical protein